MIGKNPTFPQDAMIPDAVWLIQRLLSDLWLADKIRWTQSHILNYIIHYWLISNTYHSSEWGISCSSEIFIIHSYIHTHHLFIQYLSILSRFLLDRDYIKLFSILLPKKIGYKIFIKTILSAAYKRMHWVYWFHILRYINQKDIGLWVQIQMHW